MRNEIKKWLIKKIRYFLRKNRLTKDEQKYLDYLINKFFDLEYEIPTDNNLKSQNKTLKI